MYEETLRQAGLTKEQALIYEILVKNGPLPAGIISKKTPLKRGLTYKILDELIDLKLVEKRESPGKVTHFFPLHPLKIKGLVEKREQAAKDAQLALSGVLPSIISDFILVSGQPGIKFYEGLEGVKKIYDDIIFEKKDLLLFRSPLDKDRPELSALVTNQIKSQVKSDIKSKVLTPSDKSMSFEIKEKDYKNLVERRVIPREEFFLNAQILIYGNKVAIISLRGNNISMLIENEDISQTFKTLFDFIWKKATPAR